MTEGWTFTNLDARLAAELEAFLPEKIFDAHTHIYRVADLHVSKEDLFAQGPAEVGIGTWRDYTSKVIGESRLKGGFFLANPTADCDRVRVNEYLVEQLAAEPNCRGSVIITPDDDPKHIEELASLPEIAGFKPYHVFSRDKPTLNAEIPSFLPEWAWEIADAHGLTITLHMVKNLALADPVNQQVIRSMCLKYKNAHLILAHAARGFHAPNTGKGLRCLRGLENVWFDVAAVCEPAAVTAILNSFGPRRLLWGSDFPVTEMRGKAVTVGDGFLWLDEESVDWSKMSIHNRPTLVHIESLRAMKEAFDKFPLDKSDVEEIFYHNAVRLLKIEAEQTGRTQSLYHHAKQRIPGGTQLLSKRPERMAPDQWPAYFREARGCEIWDLDGRHYFDMSLSAIGSCLFGYRDPEISNAVLRRVRLGAMSTLNPPEEVDLADLLCEIHPWAEQVRFARTGGEVAAAAVRIARATTDRSIIAVCGYHGWHDWYLAANLGGDDALRGHLLPGLAPLGVPRELRGTTLTFSYGDKEAFEEIISTHGDRLAAVIMEPARGHDPDSGFLELIRDRTHDAGALLIFDEITIGFRLWLGGAHLRFGVKPDIAIFAKALGNGHPIAAVIGTRKAMKGAHGSFISSTYWTEGVGPAAALATLRKMQQIDVPAAIALIGARVVNLWRKYGEVHNLPIVIEPRYPCLGHFRFDHELANELRTLYTQIMLERGFLAGTAIYATTAHTDEIIDFYGEAVDEVFAEIADALNNDEVNKRLKGRPAVFGFERLVT